MTKRVGFRELLDLTYRPADVSVPGLRGNVEDYGGNCGGDNLTVRQIIV